MIMASIFRFLPSLMMIVHIAVYIYIVLLVGRLVRAVEKIANKIENSPKL